MNNLKHIISRDETECVTIEGDYEQARAKAITCNWLILDLGWCPLCHFVSLGGAENDLADRDGYPGTRRGRPTTAGYV